MSKPESLGTLRWPWRMFPEMMHTRTGETPQIHPLQHGRCPTIIESITVRTESEDVSERNPDCHLLTH
jgi:hypothetical protein